MRILVGGLGWPHDALAVAALRAEGVDAEALGPLDVDAFERGRAALPRGQCAPIVYGTGALLRRVARDEHAPLGLLSLRTCGPCRFALFEPAFARALSQRGRGDVAMIPVGQDLDALRGWLGDRGASRAVDALLVADAVREHGHRLRPHVAEPEALEDRARAAVERLTRGVEEGLDPIAALRGVAGWHRGLALRPEPAIARVALVGEPWSLHVDGDGQLDACRRLAAAGAEVEVPPIALWMLYLSWQARSAPFGAGPPPDRGRIEAARALERRVRSRLAEAAAAVGIGAWPVPDVDELTRLAAPHLSPGLRGGYGHLEVGLAVRARRERRAHLVLSVKSFGCVPSSGVSDAIVPTALGPELPFLALEVTGDGEAARESRLALRLSAALDAAERELRDARALGPGDAGPLAPLAGRYEVGPRRYASTLACHVAEAQRPALAGQP